MKFLWGTLANDLRGLDIEEQSDLLGFLLSDHESGHSFFTVYCAPDNKYSVYSAIDDIYRGIKVEDERPLLLNASLGSVVTAIRNEQRRLGMTNGESFANYFGVTTPSDGMRNQWKYSSRSSLPSGHQMPSDDLNDLLVEDGVEY